MSKIFLVSVIFGVEIRVGRSVLNLKKKTPKLSSKKKLFSFSIITCFQTVCLCCLQAFQLNLCRRLGWNIANVKRAWHHFFTKLIFWSDFRVFLGTVHNNNNWQPFWIRGKNNGFPEFIIAIYCLWHHTVRENTVRICGHKNFPSYINHIQISTNLCKNKLFLECLTKDWTVF